MGLARVGCVALSLWLSPVQTTPAYGTEISMRHSIVFLLFVSLTFALMNPAVAQWVQTSGPFGATQILSLAVNGSIVFAGTPAVAAPTSTRNRRYSDTRFSAAGSTGRIFLSSRSGGCRLDSHREYGKALRASILRLGFFQLSVRR
jgi:hypothetical protein